MMECTKCGEKKNKKNDHSKLTVNGKNHRLKLDNATKSVCEVCAEEEFLIYFNKFNKYVSLDEGKVSVDWKYYSKLDKEMKLGLAKILVALGILAYESQRNWEIVGKGSNLNPKIQEQTLYFRRKEDVLSFAISNYSWTSYPCEVRKISKAIRQEEFIS